MKKEEMTRILIKAKTQQYALAGCSGVSHSLYACTAIYKAFQPINCAIC